MCFIINGKLKGQRIHWSDLIEIVKYNIKIKCNHQNDGIAVKVVAFRWTGNKKQNTEKQFKFKSYSNWKIFQIFIINLYTR